MGTTINPHFPPSAARHQERPRGALEGPLRAIGRAEAIVHLDRRSPPPGRRRCRLLQLEPATSLSPSDLTLKPLLLGEHPVDVTMSVVSRLVASSTAPCPVGPESSGKLSPTSTNPPLTSTPLATSLSGLAPPSFVTFGHSPQHHCAGLNAVRVTEKSCRRIPMKLGI